MKNAMICHTLFQLYWKQNKKIDEVWTRSGLKPNTFLEHSKVWYLNVLIILRKYTVMKYITN